MPHTSQVKLQETNGHVCVAFYGLTRSLRLTHSSIEEFLLEPLRAHAQRLSVFVHTYNLSEITNKRSQEQNARLNHSEFHLLRPTRFKVGDQDAFDATINVSAYTSQGDPWKDGWRSLRNLLRMENSLQEVTDLWMEFQPPCWRVVVTRPDLLLLNPFNVTDMHMVSPRFWMVPEFASWGGINCRFAMGDFEGMALYGKKFDWIRAYSKAAPLHTESMLKARALNLGITVRNTRMCSVRVRATGQIQSSDLTELPRKPDICRTCCALMRHAFINATTPN